MQRRDSEELPEIKDYSNASPWEDFTAAIQEVVRGWLVDAAGEAERTAEVRFEGRGAYVLSAHGALRAPADAPAPPRFALPAFMRELADPAGDFRGGVLELRPRDAKVRRRVRVHFARALARCRVVPRETVFRRTRQRLAPGDEGGLVVLPGERRRQ